MLYITQLTAVPAGAILPSISVSDVSILWMKGTGEWSLIASLITIVRYGSLLRSSLMEVEKVNLFRVGWNVIFPSRSLLSSISRLQKNFHCNATFNRSPQSFSFFSSYKENLLHILSLPSFPPSSPSLLLFCSFLCLSQHLLSS